MSPYSHINGMYEWQYPHVLKCQKTGISSGKRPGITIPKFNPYGTWPGRVLTQKLFEHTLIKFSDKHPCDMGENVQGARIQSPSHH